MRRLGLIGDVHAEDEKLEQVLHFLGQQQLDRLLCTGDVVDGPGDVDRCCRLLLDADVITVRGNHERWLFQPQRPLLPDATQRANLDVSSLQFLRSLPEIVEIQTADSLFVLCHGLPGNDMAQLRPDDFGYALEANYDLLRLQMEARYSLVINGHTHRRMVRQFPGVTVVNAGTLYREHNPCCAVLDLEQRNVSFSNLLPGGEIETAAVLPLG
ncbi:MAG: metallophosphoesterase family protein [Actinomycetota bacterium]